MKIIDNIRYRFIELEEEPIPEEILEKYPKPQNMSKENEAIFDYAIRNLYNPEDIITAEEIIKDSEGFRPFVYDDLGNTYKELTLNDKVKGNKTYGIGFRYTKEGKPVEIGMHITENEADEYLHELVKNYAYGIQKSIKVPLTQSQFNAIISFTYNLHNGDPNNILQNSLIKLLNKGDYIGVSEKFNEYVYSKNVKVQGLVNRRKRESELFKSDFIEIFSNE